MYKTKQGTKNAIVQITADVYLQTMLEKKLFVGLQRCRVKDDFNLRRCWNCQGYGHSANKCIRETVCGKCAGNHETRDCDNLEKKVCTNCVLSNTYSRNSKKRETDHTVSDIHVCETYRIQWERMFAKTNYPFKPEMLKNREITPFLSSSNIRP